MAPPKQQHPEMKNKSPYRAVLGLAAAVTASLGIAAGTANLTRAQTPDPELAALNARASALDAEDYRFVQPVCTRCHSPESSRR